MEWSGLEVHNFVYGTYNLNGINAALRDMRLDFQFKSHGDSVADIPTIKSGYVVMIQNHGWKHSHFLQMEIFPEFLNERQVLNYQIC